MVILISGQLFAQAKTNINALNGMVIELEKTWKEKQARVDEKWNNADVLITSMVG
jgi:RNA-binding protein YlmH